MDPDPPSPNPSPRKVRFAPKAPTRRTGKPAQPKSETVSDDNTLHDEAAKARLLHRVNVTEHLGKRGPRVENKSAVRVAFSHGAAASTTPLRTFGKPREENAEKMYTTKLEDSTGQIVVSSASTVTADADESGCSSSPVIASSRKSKKEYREPWDYHRTYYPTVLPLRRPYSGDPELLDEEEFGEAAGKLVFDENAINSASRLGLLEENEEAQMLFLQLPPKLPIDEQVVRAPGEKGKEKVGSSISSMDSRVSAGKGKKIAGSTTKDYWLEDLPAGYMGKMLVYKSGAVKLKLGENPYDVSTGHENTFAQDLMAINLRDKDCSRIGELGKRAVVSIQYDWLSDHESD